jgi:hypothetical protein
MVFPTALDDFDRLAEEWFFVRFRHVLSVRPVEYHAAVDVVLMRVKVIPASHHPF